MYLSRFWLTVIFKGKRPSSALQAILEALLFISKYRLQNWRCAFSICEPSQVLKSGLAYTPQPNCKLVKLCSGVIRCSKTSLGTWRNNKQRPLSSQFSWCDTRSDLDYTRSCRLLYVSEPLDYVFERCSIVLLESGVLEAFTFRETALRSAWDLLAGNTHLWLRKGKRTW